MGKWFLSLLAGALLISHGTLSAMAPLSHDIDNDTMSGEVRTGEDFFVRWKPEATPEAIQAHYDQAGLRVLWRSELVRGLERVEPRQRSVDNALTAMQALGRCDLVQYAEPNYRVTRKASVQSAVQGAGEVSAHASTWAAPNDPDYSKQWALHGKYGINIEKAWEITKGSKAVKVAVLDTGCDTTHVEFKSKMAPGYDFVKKSTQMTENAGGHGTHVTGILGANSNNGKGMAGINFQLTIIPLRICPEGVADETDADVIAAFEHAAKQGVRVANCSFAKKQSAQAVGDTISATGEKGLLAVAGAGNDAADLNKSPVYPAAFCTDNMIVVASTGKGGKLTYSSNYGLNKVHLAAPGDDILSCAPKDQYVTKSGTSMAAPHVSGVAALVLAANPQLTVEQVKDIILKSVKLAPKLKNKVITEGILDAGAAVQAAKRLADEK